MVAVSGGWWVGLSGAGAAGGDHYLFFGTRYPRFDGSWLLCVDSLASCGTCFSSFAAAARPDKAGSLAAEFRRTPVVQRP
ncbi:hypothetical protein GCM10009804_39320 [Kribbella hippodromi]|uniref:Secreted protein n=1 Tax=Kribbella hippodromi TaxID=434347 RepID=A0ABN2DK55_9ACTN